jgi:hypothetical protein
MVAHGLLLAAMGYFIWPRITVSPAHVAYRGFPDETFNFSVRNGRADDIYDVQLPFLIGYGKHFENKLSATVTSSREPSSVIQIDYSYCFGKKGDGIVSHVQPNEREVLIVRIAHLVPYGFGSFSIKYTGGEKFDARSEEPSFADEPTSYSPVENTVGVRGDYRICGYFMHAIKPEEK